MRVSESEKRAMLNMEKLLLEVTEMDDFTNYVLKRKQNSITTAPNNYDSEIQVLAFSAHVKYNLMSFGNIVVAVF